MVQNAEEFNAREREVLHLLAQWNITDEELGIGLNLSPSAAHFHICKVMKKTDIHDRARLMRYAVQNGYGKLGVLV